jgi:hypothetical protein
VLRSVERCRSSTEFLGDSACFLVP